jgi:hypothetical protein
MCAEAYGIACRRPSFVTVIAGASALDWPQYPVVTKMVT